MLSIHSIEHPPLLTSTLPMCGLLLLWSSAITPRRFTGPGPQRLEEVETRKPAEKRKELEPVPMDDQPEGQSQPASSKVRDLKDLLPRRSIPSILWMCSDEPLIFKSFRSHQVYGSTFVCGHSSTGPPWMTE